MSKNRKAWDELLDRTLRSWIRDPSQIDDDGCTTPSKELMERATKCAEQLRNHGQPVATSIVPDANGGVVIDWQWKNAKESREVYHFWDDGSVEYMLFRKCKLIMRRPASEFNE